jgi:CHAT domain-containing protein
MDHQEAFAKLYRDSGALGPLRHTREEIEVVAPAKEDVRLLGPDATEMRFRRALAKRSRWRAVHFACHGLVDFDHPGWSSLAVTPDGIDDGYIAVSEIVGMRVPADLAVLSACSTGLGRTLRGEGLIALPGAFLHAGTSRVLASLWKVEDRVAREMMTEFYRLWNPADGSGGTGAAAALKKAQETHRKKGYDHPRHWAAWVLWGLPD